MPSLSPLLAAADVPAALAQSMWPWAVLAALLGAAVATLALLLLAQRRRSLDAFRALAADALQRNNEGFLTLAAERFRSLQEAGGAALDSRYKAVEELVAPLSESLERLQQETRELERERIGQAGRVGEQLRLLAEQTGRLSTALRAPAARGRWGELTLRRTVELAGLSAHCDFAEQVSLRGAEGTARPDLVVKLPSGREVAVDAKAPLDAYLDAASADSDERRAQALQRHARQVRRHVEELAGRAYDRKLARAPEFVVLFLPHEGCLAAAVEQDASLVADALARAVVVATPATLYALLGAVAQGWREQRIAESTQRILDMAGEMDERLGVLSEHLTRLGGTLSRAVDHFNAAVGSFETRVLVQARRMRELGVRGTRSLDAPAPVATDPRGAATERATE
jgi:DNA recombination protein RmuC